VSKVVFSSWTGGSEVFFGLAESFESGRFAGREAGWKLGLSVSGDRQVEFLTGFLTGESARLNVFGQARRKASDLPVRD